MLTKFSPYMSIERARRRRFIPEKGRYVEERDKNRKKETKNVKGTLKLKEETVNFIVKPLVSSRSINFELKSGREQHSTVTTMFSATQISDS